MRALKRNNVIQVAAIEEVKEEIKLEEETLD